MFLIVECEVGGMLEDQAADDHRLRVPDLEMGFHIPDLLRKPVQQRMVVEFMVIGPV